MNPTLEFTSVKSSLVAETRREDLRGVVEGVASTLVPTTRELNAFYTLFLRHPSKEREREREREREDRNGRDPLMSGDSAKC